MNKLLTILLTICFTLCLFSGTVTAKWSLLEDYQMNDVAGDEGVCVSSMKADCDFDSQIYGMDYSEDELKDDMDEARENGLEMIWYDYSFKHQSVPYETNISAQEKPVPGDPFFQSDWFSPGFSGWEELCEELLKFVPCE